jgi:hypothetical protein
MFPLKNTSHLALILGRGAQPRILLFRPMCQVCRLAALEQSCGNAHARVSVNLGMWDANQRIL